MEKDNQKFVKHAMQCNFFQEVENNSTLAFNLLTKKYVPNLNKAEVAKKKKQLQRKWIRDKSVLQQIYNKIVESNVFFVCIYFLETFVFQ